MMIFIGHENIKMIYEISIIRNSKCKNIGIFNMKHLKIKHKHYTTLSDQNWFIKPLMLLLFVFFNTGLLQAQQSIPENLFQWDELKLPPSEGVTNQLGLAGAFSGVSNGALIIAGGANFPNVPAWEGGAKVWWEDIYVLLKDQGTFYWADVKSKLPKPAAYGVSIATENGLLCIGGTNQDGQLAEVFQLKWDAIQKTVTYENLGILPSGFQATAGVAIGSNVYISGISKDANQLISASISDIQDTGETISWKTLEGCPGPPRTMMVYTAQSNGEDMCFYQFSGRSQTKEGTKLLSDSYAFNTESETWINIGNVSVDDHSSHVLMGAPAISYGSNSIFIFGGDDGELFLQRQKLENNISLASTDSQKEKLQEELKTSFLKHPGFSQDIIMFNTVTNTFDKVGTLPKESPVVTNGILWDEKVILPSGEIRPGVRSPKVLVGGILKDEGAFGVLNYIMLGLYFIVLLIMGIFFSSRQKTTDDYFKGGGRIPWWAAGISIFGTALSAITFMAIPAKTYATDWSYFFNNMSVLLITPVVVLCFIPFYRRLNVTTAYEYLEQRFNIIVRLFGSISFILFQIGRIAIVLYLPAIALSLVTGIDVYLCILTVGVLSTIYTLIGGIEAVIWTDVIQVVVLMGGALLVLVIILFSLDGDFISNFELASKQGKFNLVDLNFSFQEPTIWVVIIGGFFANLVTYSSDQTIVQRYLTTSDESGAKRTAWTNALLIIPSTLLFFSVGTALFLFYQQHPLKADPLAQDIDAVFPWYIIKELPNGISGILIAGLFSAAMSSLSSSLNSVSTAFTTDFYQRFKVKSDHNKMMKVAKISTFVAGTLGTLFALWMSNVGIVSLWDQFFTVLGLFTGGLGGVFFLGVISKKANATGAIIGLIGSSMVQYYVAYYSSLHIFLYAATGFLTCVIVGHLASLIIPDKNNEAGKQLTIFNKFFTDKERVEKQDI